MANFSELDIDRVLGALGFPADQLTISLVTARINEIPPVAGDRLLEYLDRYEAAETAWSSDARNNGLIKADVLEWSAGSVAFSLAGQVSYWQGKIAGTLRLADCDRGNRRIRS